MFEKVMGKKLRQGFMICKYALSILEKVMSKIIAPGFLGFLSVLF